MTCHSYNEIIHNYLDGEATQEEKEALYRHLDSCMHCQTHVNELKKSIAFIQSSSHIEAPAHFTTTVMSSLPTQKKSVPKVKAFLKRHPLLAAVAVFLIMMSTAIFSSWSQSTDGIVVSGNGSFVIDKESGVVTIPEGSVIEGDLMVRNGELELDGEVRGDVLLLNSSFSAETLYASPNQVTGEIEQIDQALSWVWYHIKAFFTDVFALFSIEKTE